MKKTLLTLAVTAAISTSAFAVDFGQKVELLAKAQSLSLFGVISPLGASSTTSLSAAAANATPAGLVTLASGLTAKVVRADANLGASIDMMALWPNDTNPTQRIEIAAGAVANILSSGLTSCDPVHRTAWGTIVFGEENGSNGRVFELLDPLATTGVTVSGSGAATTTSDPAHVAFRPALGQLSFEGIALYPNGVMYFGDENRPGNGNPGGAYFKFIPNTLWSVGGPAITDLANSPLASGSIYGMRIGKRSSNTDYGQANEFGPTCGCPSPVPHRSISAPPPPPRSSPAISPESSHPRSKGAGGRQCARQRQHHRGRHSRSRQSFWRNGLHHRRHARAGGGHADALHAEVSAARRR